MFVALSAFSTMNRGVVPPRHPQGREDLFRFVDLIDAHLKKRTRFGIERGFPKLVWVHLAKAFIGLDCQIVPTLANDGVDKRRWARDIFWLAVFDCKAGGRAEPRLQVARYAIKSPRLRRAQGVGIDGKARRYAAFQAREKHAAADARRGGPPRSSGGNTASSRLAT